MALVQINTVSVTCDEGDVFTAPRRVMRDGVAFIDPDEIAHVRFSHIDGGDKWTVITMSDGAVYVTDLSPDKIAAITS